MMVTMMTFMMTDKICKLEINVALANGVDDL